MVVIALKGEQVLNGKTIILFLRKTTPLSESHLPLIKPTIIFWYKVNH
jgi:hypothetical protein